MGDGPIICGFRLGGLVQVQEPDAQEISDAGEDVSKELGQLVSYDASREKFLVALLNGITAYFSPKSLEAVSDLLKPGEIGGEDGFDLVLGPCTSGDALARELTLCMMEKGYCKLRVCQKAEQVASTIDVLRDMAIDGGLSRLPDEVEEGYLGQNCRGKITWFDDENSKLKDDELLMNIEGNVAFIAQLIQGYSDDLFGEGMDERTPGLICLTMQGQEELEYPPPEADDKTLGTFLGMWRRRLMQAVTFMGPGTTEIVLDAKSSSQATLPKLQESISLQLYPHSILLYRTDSYDYTCSLPDEESLMVCSSFLSPAPNLVWGSISGETSWLTAMGEGPPPPPGRDHINVVNTSTRLPGCWDDAWMYWAGLNGATDGVIKTPITRWDNDIYYHKDEDTMQPWQTNVQHQSLVEGVELFDNRAFEISNTEAGGMDPVQRHIMELGSVNFAMMGLTKKVCNRKSTHAGVAVGNDKLDWGPMPKDVELGALGGTSTVLAIIANRFSFAFNLKGPSFVCDTACSASLASTHCAKMMLYERVYDPIEFFLSVGAHLVLRGPFINSAHMFSSEGRCFTFNASADGYLRGEGFVSMIMKYDDLDGDKDALMRSTQVGQDGRSASLTAPNGPAQEEMINRAIKEARMTPPESTVWECHGTGTSLGDPIEVGAVRKTQVRMQRLEPLMVTSVKTNMGHLEGGAAMGGMVKCVLQCKYTKCCPTVHLRTLNAHLEHTAFDAIFETEAANYHYTQGHSQVSSFGFGGTNAHGIFWGRNMAYSPDAEQAFMKRLKMMKPPEVRPSGSSPYEWDSDFPDFKNIKPGTAFTICMNPEDPVDAPIRYEPVEEEPEDDEDCFFAITGNFNDWSEERMTEGNVPGLATFGLEVPDDGVVEFYFLKNGEEDQVLCPSVDECSKRVTPILGPGNQAKNKWRVKAEAGLEMMIELFVKDGKKTVTWIIMR